MNVQVRVSPSLEFEADGIGKINLKDVEDLDYVIKKILLDHPYLIFRGQREASWPLRTSLDRLYISAKERLPTHENALSPLEKFKYSTRGRLPTHTFPTDNDSWWALGQHFGLATPLLDWTESPFVASYFAFLKESEQNEEGAYPKRAIWALDPNQIIKKSEELEEVEQVHIINPLTDQNPRIINQRGLLSRLPVGIDLEKWVEKHFSGVDSHYVLIKIEIPEFIGDRNKHLQYLNRANINSLTLFPDLTGASEHCNDSILIHKYE